MTVNKLRFAPSPTGNLHIGNARTLILNYIYSKAIDGKLILRIDDTDAERSEERYYQSILNDIDWLEIDIFDIKRQSEKKEKYQDIANKLIEQGKLYPCFETDEELNRARKLSLSRGQPPIYDRSALNLTEEQKNTYKANGINPYWRFKLDREVVEWNDLIRGRQTIDCGSFSDPVLIRADGTFLYTLPSVVDDIDLEITHILRGEDHVSNTATQIQLFKTLNASIPNFGHHSLMVQKDGSRMSKRSGSLSLEEVRESGIEPITLINYCARIGTSDAVEAFQTTDELVKNYDLSKISRSPARFSVEELEVLNKKIIQNIPFERASDRLEQDGISGESAEKFWNVIRTNINNIHEAKKWWDIVGDNPIDTNKIVNKDVIIAAKELLPEDPWNENTWSEWTGKIAAKTGLKGKELYLPIRIALTGETSGPELATFILFLGKEKVQKRLDYYL